LRVKDLSVHPKGRQKTWVTKYIETVIESYGKEGVDIDREDIFFMISADHKVFYEAFGEAIQLVFSREEEVKLTDADMDALRAMKISDEELGNIEILFKEIIINVEREEKMNEVIQQVGTKG
jgi:hypothetical protein